VTAAREDPELELPHPPDVVPALGPLAGGLELACAAGARGLLVEGGGSFVVGTERGPLDQVWIGGERVAADVATDAGPVANVLVRPGVVTRERVGPGGTLHERVVVVEALPLVAIQWVGSGADLLGEIHVGLAAPGGTERVGSGPAAAVVEGLEGRIVAAAISPTPLELSTSVAPDRVSVRVRPAPGDVVTLLLSAGAPEVVQQALSAAAHLPAHARRALRPDADDTLGLRTGVGEIDDGVEWAKARTAAVLSQAPSGDPVWATLAAAAVGDRDAAALGVDAALARSWDRGALLAAILATTFGDQRRALECARAVVGPARGAGPAPVTDGADPPRAWERLALRALAEALHHGAGPELVAGLKQAAGRIRPAGPRPLPMAGAAAPPDPAEWLSSLLAGEPSAPHPEGATEGERSLYALPTLARSDPDAAWSRWRDRLTRGLQDGVAGLGTWDRPGPQATAARPVTSAVLLTLAHGVLGLSPDALAGRIRVAPRFPSHLRAFSAHGIPVGASRIALRFERDGGVHRYTLEPTRASVPPLAVFEPAVSGPVSEVRIDGAPADLDPRAHGSRTVIPMSLPLDATRTVEIVTRLG